ncbi:ABC-type antimicrobial peptide transport system, permease component [Terriglobus roseus DSM 18391]|uniref:ABC-type antimicrobial peptide transport system, permease component n=1 Tax=Terriglobus roseus (strain DSM 18391 / NRRL B-41598 / KBS 63) TaxID=926566 RepID=I3ZDI6_TERRK|nr:ABC transporter permease [Terriglobus roseus]AFL87304.1 ABC-type antimicrobial peptide transport system, permease component [Terriglobus roseus DSM 18391]
MAVTDNRQSTFEGTLRSAKTSLMFSETLRLALDSFRASKIRFLLTMLGMIIGSASIVLVVTVGLTGRQYALDTLSSIGPNMVEMQYNGGATIGPDGASTPDYMTREDEAAVLAQIPGIAQSSPMLEIHTPVSVGDGKVKDVMLLGVSPRYKDVRNLGVLAGRFFDDQDSVMHDKVGVMVEPLAKEIYGSSQAAVGKVLSMSGVPVTIIGVFKQRVDTFGQSEISETTMLLPYTVARYFTGTDTVKEIFFTMKDPADVPRGGARILELIRSRHRKTSNYTAFTMVAILDTMAKVADSLTYVLTAAAFITLVVSGVGIMNSMLANVSARIREIGIRKALGATKREIRLQFLTEAVFLSLCGGVVGTLLGLAVPISVNLLTPVHIPMSWLSAVVALFTSVLVGVIFGTLPANRAASLDPVETLKYE